jgi:hypothetical protein
LSESPGSRGFIRSWLSGMGHNRKSNT